ncbi:recombinase family protein, partial [Bacillus anthracis]
LRKSRADLEAEARGEGETLAKHRTTLLKIAKEMNLNGLSVREEIVSGESLVKRPEMLALLEEIEDNKYDVVLCMDMDRLGRGGMKEQGIILETFKRSNTKIMTPRKTYDLNDEWDEEYSEFEAFMARKEV